MSSKPTFKTFSDRRYRIYADGTLKTLINGLWTPVLTRLNHNGYRVASISVNGRRGIWFVHWIVLTFFKCQPRPAGLMCRHLDGDRLNNSSSNLCWGTMKENAQDTVRHGMSGKGLKKSPETCARISASKKGVPATAEAKAALSRCKMGNRIKPRMLTEEKQIILRDKFNGAGLSVHQFSMKFHEEFGMTKMGMYYTINMKRWPEK